MSDRHFDQLATRFAEKIYGGAKGAIRLAVLQADLTEALPKRPLRVLDIGAGLGHMSLWLAEQGHEVTLAEPAEPMLEGARQRFADAGQTATFIHAPWQDLLGQLTEPYDLVLCHAVLEWLAEPELAIAQLKRLLLPGGILSLMFYNKDAKRFGNILFGNFDYVAADFQVKKKVSLNPQQPLVPADVAQWCQQAGFTLLQKTGVRCFHDYLRDRALQQSHFDQLLALELQYNRTEPYASLGRYQHLLLRADT